jgi:Molybdopterin converting factor, small subunit
MINVLFFGMIRDITGSNRMEMPEAGDTNELISNLNSMFPSLTGAKYIVAVDRDIIQNNTRLQQDAEVALLPPFSGG